MEQTRNFAFMVLLVTAIMLFFSWQSDLHDLEKSSKVDQSENVNLVVNNKASSNTINVKTDVYDINIDLVGGDVVSASLPKYNKSTEDSSPFELLQNKQNFSYTLSSALLGSDGIDKENRPTYTASDKIYRLIGDNPLTIPLEFSNSDINVTKKFVFYPGRYDFDISYEITNKTNRELSVRTFGEIVQTIEPPKQNDQNLFIAGSYRGGIYSSEDTNYKKISLEELAENKKLNHITTTKGGWIGMIQHYFAVAYIGNKGETNSIYNRGTGENPNNITESSESRLSMYGEIQKINPNDKLTISNKVWVGPKDQEKMDDIAPKLGRTLDYGWLWFISEFLMTILKFIYSFVHNWGFAIIIITILVRGCMYPLTKAQYTSMAKMKLIAPKLKEIRDRYQQDPENYRKATMDLYKTEKVNPAAGCLPILIQMPIFIALYWALMESTDLRQAPFIGWIKDLSVNDPYFILPLLYGATMFLVQKLSMSQNSTQMINPMQQKIFMMMPVIFTLMFMMFPAGLTLYWTVSNVITIIQMKLIYSHLEKTGLKTKVVKNK
jgi:YidC/Oxa1 family membrane protein insertase